MASFGPNMAISEGIVKIVSDPGSGFNSFVGSVRLPLHKMLERKKSGKLPHLAPRFCLCAKNFRE